jgi:hypothetical protein
MNEPVRPASVPADAVYDVASALWELAEHDEHGRRHGSFSAFAADGALVTRGSYREGRRDGTFSTFSGEGPAARPLRACCVPPGARELRTRFHAGRVLDETFYDDHGRGLCDDGTPWPERDARVPDSARFEPANGRFIDRLEHAEGYATLRVYEPHGSLAEEVEIVAGKARRHRRFAADGSCREETELDERGERHGGFFARFAAEEPRYADARVREVRGRHEHGEPVGSWELRDAGGLILRRVEYGDVLAEVTPYVAGTEPDVAATEPDVAGTQPYAESLWALAASPARAPREAMALAVRAFVTSRDRERFERYLAERIAPLRPEPAGAAAEGAVASPARPSALLGSLLGGAAPAAPLRLLASSLRGNAPAALEYFDASLLFAPEQALVGLGRALLCIEHGDPAGALAAAELAGRENADAAEPLRQFCRVTYDAFAFRPARDGIAPPDAELVEVELAQPLPAIERAVELYATRLLTVRNELARRAHGTPSWLPPDTRELLPRGELALRRYTAQIEDEGENGPELSEAEVDETLELTRSTRELLGTARCDWAALSWLCWAAGLDEIARPSRLVARPEFAAAAHQATVRCWRAHDQVRTKGLVALARNVASFAWEGMPIEVVPPHLLELAAAEYLEVRAVFFWLLFPQNQSPFQRDLRRV